tara:strand:+ start:80 stop:241 length:162 start_codon:yes stop_codon:yes gene_type:complete
MLPIHIIEDIRKREKKEEKVSPKYLELEIPSAPRPPNKEEAEDNRGVVVIDLY